MKVEIEFPVDYLSEHCLPLHLGRLQLGPYVARITFHEDGSMRLYVPKQAIEKGYVIPWDAEDAAGRITG